MNWNEWNNINEKYKKQINYILAELITAIYILENLK